MSEKWSFVASIFSNLKKGTKVRPFNILNDNTNSLGYRTSFNYKDHLFSLPFEVSLESELMYEQYTKSLFQNLYLSKPGQG